LSFLRRATPVGKGGVSTFEDLAATAVVSEEVLGKEGLDALDDDPSYLVLGNERLDELPPVLTEKLIARTEALKASVTCEGTFVSWEHQKCTHLVSSSFCQLVQDFSGGDAWHKCRACTCPCVYDPDVEFHTCDTCRKAVCNRCKSGCECPNADR
jgi:hypothetical protein